MASCYTSYVKKHLNRTADWLIKQECCDRITCSDLARDLQDLQYKCNDLYGDLHELNRDEKGNIIGTLCSKLKNKKIMTLNKLKLFEARGGKKSKSKSQRKKQKSKSKNTRRR